MAKTILTTPTIDLVSTSDTGRSTTDNITSDTTPALTGKATAGSVVTIKDGNTVLGTATANSSGVWTFTTKALADGAHSLTVSAKDADGNVSAASTALRVTVDKVAPTAPTIDLAATSDSGGSSADNVTNDSTPTLTGKAEAGSIVTIKDGDTVLGTATANSSGVWTFTT